MKGEKFLIAGCDKRMRECRERLSEYGYYAECYTENQFVEHFGEFKYIVLPLKSFVNGVVSGTGMRIQELKDRLIDDKYVFYGISDSNPFEYKGCSYYNKNFITKNSRLTAQGVLRIILEIIEKDLLHCKVAVLGYGNCGKAICSMLKDNGLKVTSFSRKSVTRFLAQDNGFSTGDISEIDCEIDSFDIIVNTVPFNVISKYGIDKLNDNHIFIEVASYPYAFSADEYSELKFNYILASGLPGRFTPQSAGAYIADTIVEILKEGKYG